MNESRLMYCRNRLRKRLKLKILWFWVESFVIAWGSMRNFSNSSLEVKDCATNKHGIIWGTKLPSTKEEGSKVWMREKKCVTFNLPEAFTSCLDCSRAIKAFHYCRFRWIQVIKDGWRKSLALQATTYYHQMKCYIFVFVSFWQFCHLI